MLEAGKSLAVFSIKEGKNGSIWIRVGKAEVNRDNSVNMTLDVLPFDGKLHIRESTEKHSESKPVH